MYLIKLKIKNIFNYFNYYNSSIPLKIESLLGGDPATFEYFKREMFSISLTHYSDIIVIGLSSDDYKKYEPIYEQAYNKFKHLAYNIGHFPKNLTRFGATFLINFINREVNLIKLSQLKMKELLE